MARSLISPSNFERRMLCAGSLQAEMGLPESTSVYSEDGKMLHDVVYSIMISNVFDKVDEFTKLNDRFKEHFECKIESSYGTLTIDAFYKIDSDFLTLDQEKAVNNVINFLVNLKTIESICFYEKEVDLSFIYEGMSGTADCVLIQYDSFKKIYNLHIIDFKFGKGLQVFAYKNYQLLLYYLGVINDSEIKELFKDNNYNVHLHIVQPYKHDSVWSLTDEEKEFYSNLEMYREVANNCYKPDAIRTASKKACQFCKAKPTCPALASFVPSINTPIKELNDFEIAKIYENKELINLYIESLEKYIIERLTNGKFLTYSLRKKLNNRKWSEDAYDFLVDKLGDEAFDVKKKLISLSKAESLIGKEMVNELTVREEGSYEIIKMEERVKDIFKNLNI